MRRAIRPEPGSVEVACPRAVVRASRARAMAWTAAERTARPVFGKRQREVGLSGHESPLERSGRTIWPGGG